MGTRAGIPVLVLAGKFCTWTVCARLSLFGQCSSFTSRLDHVLIGLSGDSVLRLRPPASGFCYSAILSIHPEYYKHGHMDLDILGLFFLHLPSLPAFLVISRMWIHRVLLGLLQFFLIARCTPPGFPSTGNGLWYREPGIIWSRDWLPVGNGYLAGAYHISYLSGLY